MQGGGGLEWSESTPPPKSLGSSFGGACCLTLLQASRALSDDFRTNSVHKEYHTVLVGALPGPVDCHLPIMQCCRVDDGPTTTLRGRMCTHATGKPAHTRFEPVRVVDGLTLCRVLLYSGMASLCIVPRARHVCHRTHVSTIGIACVPDALMEEAQGNYYAPHECTACQCLDVQECSPFLLSPHRRTT